MYEEDFVDNIVYIKKSYHRNWDGSKHKERTLLIFFSNDVINIKALIVNHWALALVARRWTFQKKVLPLSLANDKVNYPPHVGCHYMWSPLSTIHGVHYIKVWVDLFHSWRQISFFDEDKYRPNWAQMSNRRYIRLD